MICDLSSSEVKSGITIRRNQQHLIGTWAEDDGRDAHELLPLWNKFPLND